MEYPSQLTPVQAWILGYIDTATLGDLAAAMDGDACASVLESYGRAISDERYSSDLMTDAYVALAEPPDDEPPPGGRLPAMTRIELAAGVR